MNLSEINNQLKQKKKLAEKEYLYSIGQWIKSFKPDAKTFEFEGYSEYNDEGGSSMYFRSLYIDGEDLEEIVKNLPKDKVLEYFEICNYDKERFSGYDIDRVWDAVRDDLTFDDCVYEHRKQTIDA